MEPLILTARPQQETQTYFDQLRQRHFPPERNFVPAHLTLFHALPQANRNAIRMQLHEITRREPPYRGIFLKVQSLGRGVALSSIVPGLASSLRASLTQLWHRELTAQDRQTPRLHITVQNKSPPEATRSLLDELNRDFKPKTLLFEGLDLWRYLGGPWSLMEAFSFTEEN